MPLPSLIRLLLLAALWGGSYLSMRIAVPVLGALPTAGGRVLLGALGLGLLVLLQRVPLRFVGKGRAALALGVVNSGIPFAMYALAAQVLPAGYSAILNALTPLMGVLLGTLFFGERITVHKLAGVCVGLAGVAVLVRTGPQAHLGGPCCCRRPSGQTLSGRNGPGMTFRYSLRRGLLCSSSGGLHCFCRAAPSPQPCPRFIPYFFPCPLSPLPPLRP